MPPCITATSIHTCLVLWYPLTSRYIHNSQSSCADAPYNVLLTSIRRRMQPTYYPTPMLYAQVLRDVDVIPGVSG